MPDNDVRVKLTCKQSLGTSFGTDIATGDILGPLLPDNGVIFPYTPMINAAYSTSYGSHQPIHSNFVYRFFQNYSMQEITCSADLQHQLLLKQDTWLPHYISLNQQ